MVSVGHVRFGGDNPLVLIAGPCVIESRDGCLMLAEEISAVAASLKTPYIFKASYDKANRTSVDSFRGLGIEEGLAILSEVREEIGCPVLTDVHSPEEAQAAASAVDVLQIPAFLCRQTDLLVAAGETGKPVNVKKGQFMAPEDMTHAVAKVQSTGNERVLLTERGATFGYQNLVVDFRSLEIMRQTGCPIIFDATHSVQRPGGAGGVSGGDREFVPLLARAAAAVGIDGLFLEVHDRPQEAKSDGPNMVPLHELEPLLRQVLAIDRARRGEGGSL
ncbi:MAG: 3-deoxy-8-phosphooctulonate synthase [Armatimonadetes bacterium CG2_30_59_28]|nr:3-deoxy-8-phosphooctulonate synthase [Armatimonadota bacterium]OIO96708.1 MAG: 3-deoxy-8-phosphooctulonate synthase [Armatimonadetes bacterium CG2_30_59_28]PIU63896.1 MAG: 3-deoxy-8-phosphooctulonate synthase [Armatimonadetes bacterium CG07_land_8_20_14_0_80_59_28]PIX44132.1 MAG: 3-deoxy-8-phosphooctulonate synthase [Armatimonadetes bacterium CG_4_8_14_3_um_filter_58_9]PIY45943.1 MAG: 3-deoxy-8-phosphooctulonate synthase [Armatimonadetes bacterium CG_4_10_14_3_um_filter_59_10]PJB73025.1 MAG